MITLLVALVGVKLIFRELAAELLLTLILLEVLLGYSVRTFFIGEASIFGGSMAVLALTLVILTLDAVFRKYYEFVPL